MAAFHDAFDDWMVDTIQIRKASTRSSYGEQTYTASPTSYTGRVRYVSMIARTLDGEEKHVSTIVYLTGNADVVPEDQVTLPDGTKPRIVQIRTLRDENGSVDHKQLLLT